RTLTTTVTSQVTLARLFFMLPSGETGSIRPASKRGFELIPSHLTMARSTYRALRQVVDSVRGWAVGVDRFAHTATSWTESDRALTAFPGGKLEAKLIDGDAKGKELLRVTSEVTGDKEKGYTYSYVVENLSDRSLGFRWGGMREKLGPKKSFTKKEVSEKLTEEKSELLTIDFDDGEATIVMKTNLWAPPK